MKTFKLRTSAKITAMVFVLMISLLSTTTFAQQSKQDANPQLLSGGGQAWSTFYGGGHDDKVNAVATDRQGNCYITGFTKSANIAGLQTVYGAGDTLNGSAFIAAFDNKGVFLWGHYIGGDGYDEGFGIAVDTMSVAIIGTTGSANLPTSSLAYQKTYQKGNSDAFVAVFNIYGGIGIGTLKGLTYFGGLGDDHGVAITSHHNQFTAQWDFDFEITGYTTSANFPITTGAYQTVKQSCPQCSSAFVAKIDELGEMLFSTYLGGSSNDQVTSIASDASGNIIVAGTTSSTNFPVTAGAIQTTGGLFITKMSPNLGGLAWSTLYGGTGYYYSSPIEITVDGSDGASLFVTGTAVGTSYANFQLKNPGGGAYFQGAPLVTVRDTSEIFISKIDPVGQLYWGTFYRGTGTIGFMNSAAAIASDVNGNIYITGTTNSPTFPLLDAGGGAYSQSTYKGGCFGNDAYILKFNKSGVREWATYYGGNQDDNGKGIACSYNGDIFVVGTTGSDYYCSPATTNDFPTYNPGGGTYTQFYGGLVDGFIARFSGDGATAIAPINSKDENIFKVFPNPNKGAFDLITDIADKGDYSIELVNTLGQLIYSEKLAGFSGNYTRHINLNELKSGVYYLSLKGDKVNAVQKVLVW